MPERRQTQAQTPFYEDEGRVIYTVQIWHIDKLYEKDRVLYDAISYTEDKVWDEV